MVNLEKIKLENKDKIRVLNVELLDVYEYIKGHFNYKVVYLENDKVEEEHMIGKDVTDALYRFSQTKKMKFSWKLKMRE